MPLIGLAIVLLDVTCIMHARNTGRPDYWMWIILMVPIVGALAYVLLEWLPELAHTRRGRQLQTNITDVIAPDREWARRREAAMLSGSVDAKRALAEECERKGMWLDSIALYDSCAQAAFANDPVLLLGLARAHLGAHAPIDALAVLDRLQAANPDIQSQQGHLLYARALEGSGRGDEAAGEYAKLIGYYAGYEARARFGLLLLKRGDPQSARRLFEEIVSASKVRGAVLTEADANWLKVAKANM